MSAYGSIGAPKPLEPLETLIYPLKKGSISLYPVSRDEVDKVLVEYLHVVFNRELEEGKTYPQEGPLTFLEFETYFFTSASTTVIGILHSETMTEAPRDIQSAKGERSWEECVGGVFYIKPNYPGRASHNCNGGFIIPHAQRGRGASHALAQAFCIYAPKLGYRQSVFNLVFANNFSLNVWEKNGFNRVGTVPNAGRLKTGPNGSEEYVDAYIMHKSFV